MKKLYLVALLILQLALATKTTAQNVAINATGSLPDNSAMLDITSTDKGFLAPRLTTTQQNAISLPATGLLIFNTTDNVFKVNTGTPAVPLWTPLAMGSGVAISSLNGLTGIAQTFATGTTGTDFGITSSGTAHTFNMPTASAANRGALSASDWSIFNGKLGLTSLSATAPLSYNNTTGAFSINQSNTTTNGYLSSVDWNTFNGKAPLASPTFTGIPAATTAAPGTNTTQLATTAFVAAANGTNANLTGPITSVGNATSIASQTGTGSTFAMSASPTFTGTPTLPTGTIATTQTAGNNTTAIATTAFVTTATNGKIGLTSLSASAPLSYNNTTGAFTISQANTTTSGYLSSTDWNTFNNKGSGTVTAASVVSANGFSGTVATSTTTPTITLSTTVTGILKGNGTAMSAAIASDFPTLNQNTTGTAANVTGTIAVTNGGTGLTSATTGDILYGSAANTLSKLPAGANGQVLTLTSGIPSWATPAASNSWSLTGNAITAGSHFLGSTNNVSLRFRSNNTERMIIDSTGKVGVGLSDPAAGYYLSVKDNLEIRRTATTAQMIFTNTAGTGNFRIGGDGGDIYWQGGGGQSLQMGSYWATILGGDRQTATFPAFVGGITGTSVIVASQRDASVALGIQGNSATQTANLTEWKNSTGTVLTLVDKSGNVGIGVAAPTAALHLEAGTASANTAPLKFTAGTNLTIPENGAVEFNGTHFYGTVGTTRYQLDQQPATTFTGSLGGDVTGTQSATVVGKINGVSLAGLGTGILKNTTTTGVPSIAVAADFPTLNQNTTGTSANVTGTVAVANGGTGVTSVTDGGVLYGATSTTIASTAVGTTGQVLQSAGTGTPAWVNGGTMMLSGNTNNSTETTVGGGQKNYLPIVGTLSTVPVADVSAGTRSVMSRAGTIKNLYVVLDGAPGGGKNITVTIYKGGTAQTLTVAINGNVTVNGSDTTNSFTVAAGDEVGIVISSTNTPSTHRRVSWSADFTY